MYDRLNEIQWLIKASLSKKSFLANSDLIKSSECAFSVPTSDGRSFAASYSGTESFLVYKDND